MNRKPNHETITTASVEEAELVLRTRSMTGARLAHDPATCTWSSIPPLSLHCTCDPNIVLYAQPAGLFQ